MMDRDFFERSPERVASDLLGCIVVRKVDGNERKAMIVETEAYFGSDDPASRARQNGDLRFTMGMKAGTLLVYGVHNNWLFNIVTESDGVSAVLIRAVEPLNYEGKGNGPGIFTKEFFIDKSFHKTDLFEDKKILIKVCRSRNFEVERSKRIGVTKDLDSLMRFYIKDNKFVSR